MFGWIFFAQLGHFIEHIAKAATGSGLLGSSFDTEISHFLFNTAIAVLVVALLVRYPRNPWVYPLVVVALLHGIEHGYILANYMRTGISDAPGLLGRGGVLGLIALERAELHNAYNGVEMILLTLGFRNEIEVDIDTTGE